MTLCARGKAGYTLGHLRSRVNPETCCSQKRASRRQSPGTVVGLELCAQRSASIILSGLSLGSSDFMALASARPGSLGSLWP